jgi:phospholipid transport system substrate-binding protein
MNVSQIWTRAIFTILITCFSITSFAENTSNPYQLMETVSQKTFNRITQESAQINENPDYLKEIVEQEVMPYIHYQYAGLKLLGSQLKLQDKTEVEAFLEAFRAYMVTAYAQVFVQYDDQELVYAPIQPVPEGSRIVTVPVEIVEPNKPNIKLAFKWRSNKQGTEWLAFDIIAEGISMLSSKQSEWSGKIRTQGLASVTEELLEQSKIPITQKTSN